jgi:hypothetical protein
MLAGAKPSDCIHAFRSADGIHWEKVRRFPAIASSPDCPMALLRLRDGRYIAHYRHHPYSGRRICRSESWNFREWTSDPRIVMEPDAGDPTQIQFYGMGSAVYGSYEIGTLWIFHTDPNEFGNGHMNGYQETELTYARSGYAWHRAAQGQPFIPHGEPGSWEQGNLQAASQPVFLDDEIRYYYAATDMLHKTHWELDPQTAGLGMASMKPDRFIALEAGDAPAEALTVSIPVPSPQFFVNAKTEPGGWVKVGLVDAQTHPIEGCTLDDCAAITGDATIHPVRWRAGDRVPVGSRVRLRFQAKNARVYSIFATEPDEKPVYYRFRAARP